MATFKLIQYRLGNFYLSHTEERNNIAVLTPINELCLREEELKRTIFKVAATTMRPHSNSYLGVLHDSLVSQIPSCALIRQGHLFACVVISCVLISVLIIC